MLVALSRDPSQGDFAEDYAHGSQVSSLSLLRREYPDLSSLVRGKAVVDFGCGEGLESIALAREENCAVLGLDTNTRILERAIGNAAIAGLQDRQVIFLARPTKEMLGAFDVVVSQNAMEHFPDPEGVIREMKALLRPGGVLLITFGPPWFAPYGSHMHFFCRVPWLNLLFSEKTVMAVRSRYRNDGAERYVDVESGLNMMTLRRFEDFVSRSGLSIRSRRYGCVKGQDWLGRIPWIRELFVNRVTAILTNNQLI